MGTAGLNGGEQGGGVRRLAGVDTGLTEELEVVDPAADAAPDTTDADTVAPDTGDADTADPDTGVDDDAVAEHSTAEPGDADAPDVTAGTSGAAGSAGTAGSADTAAGSGAAGDLPVRPPRSRRVGRRRVVGPVIGDQLARELLGIHRQDVLLSDRCSCGEPFPCRARAFATCFVLDKAYPPADLEMPYRIVPPELRAQTGPRHAAPALGAVTTPSVSSGEAVLSGRPVEGWSGTLVAERSGTTDGKAHAASDLPVDVDATVQFAKVPVDPPVAVAS